MRKTPIAFFILFAIVACRTTATSGRQTAAEIKIETGKVWALIAQSNLPADIKAAVKESLGKVESKSQTLGEDNDKKADKIVKQEKEIAGLDFYFWLVWGIVGVAGLASLGYGFLKGAMLFKVLGGFATAATLAMSLKKIIF